MQKTQEKFTVIRDNKEKPGHGWMFSESELISGTISAHLETADYSLVGMEHLLCIERKGCISEFATNLIQARFINELIRLEAIPFSFIVLEFELRDLIGYPCTANLPPQVRAKIKINGRFLLKKLCELQCRFKTHFIFAGKYGKDIVAAIFKETINEVRRRGKE